MIKIHKVPKYGLVAVLLIASLLNISYSSVQIDNILTCDVFPKNSIPPGYDPIVGVMTNTLDENNNVANAHLSNLSSDIVSGNYDYVIACNTNNYLTLRGYVLQEGEQCDGSKGFAYVINMSDVFNAHVKSPYSSDTLSDYNYQLCILVKNNVEGTATMTYCEVRDGPCDSREVCLFKFSGIMDGGGFVDSNAHVYACDVSSTYLPSPNRNVCCRSALSSEGAVIVDISSSLRQGDSIIMQVGMYANLLTTFFNPSSKPQSLKVKIKGSDDAEGKIFENFVWFESKKGGVGTREITISLKPYERKALTINVFGGKVGKYDLYLVRETDEGEERIYNTTIIILPSSTQGVIEQSPEFGSFYMLFILIVSALLVYIRSRRLV